MTTSYEPEQNGEPDPGEVVWAWFPFEDDPDRGKDRPVLGIGRDGSELICLQLTSKDHDRDAEDEARYGWTSCCGCRRALCAAKSPPCRRRRSTRSSQRPTGTTTSDASQRRECLADPGVGHRLCGATSLVPQRDAVLLEHPAHRDQPGAG